MNESPAPINPFPQIDLNADYRLESQPRSPLRFLIDDYLAWGQRRKKTIIAREEMDITIFVEYVKRCKAERRRPPSLVAYMVRCLGPALAADPTVLGVPVGRKLFIPEKINVAMMVSAKTPTGDPIPFIMEIPDVNNRTAADIGEQIATQSRAMRREGIHNGASLKQAIQFSGLPGWARAGIYRLLCLNPKFRRYLVQTCTQFGLTSTTQYNHRSHWAVPIFPYSFGAGLFGLSQKPKVLDGRIVIRDCLDVIFVWDHNVADGVAGVQFMERWAEEVESGRLLAEFDQA